VAGEVTLADQRALLAANVAAARAGGAPVGVDRIVDVTLSELRAAGLTAVDSVVGFARERPMLAAGAGLGVIAVIGVAAYFLLREKS
jgi:hypothetical protein